MRCSSCSFEITNDTQVHLIYSLASIVLSHSHSINTRTQAVTSYPYTPELSSLKILHLLTIIRVPHHPCNLACSQPLDQSLAR